jgi:CelD/BcsL family acetyltransferase involved in cellulose biosynthesis
MTAPTPAFPHEQLSPDGAFARVEVFADPADALAPWRQLDPAACASFYQGEPFTLGWLEACGRRRGVTPFFIAAYDAADAPVALLPLGLFRFGPLRVAQFLGGGCANYLLGLFRPGAHFTPADVDALLRAAARHPGGPHLYRLLNQPLSWRGARNPLCLLAHRPSASRAYATGLQRDGEAFLAARLSADTRKKLRKKEKRLAAMGSLRFFRAQDDAQAQAILEAFFAQKDRRLPGFAAAATASGERAFYARLADFGPTGPALELHALALDGRVIASFGAGLCGGRLQGLFISYDDDPQIARSSPGELLLCHVLRDACARRIAAFDLGLGDARYKTSFCDEVEPMADVIFAPGLAGALARPLFMAALAAKAALKRHKRLTATLGVLQRRWKGFRY